MSLSRICEKQKSIGIVQDVTERKLAEEDLRAERECAQRYLDLAGVMFVALDTEGMVTLVNQRTCKLLGYTEEEIVGRNWFETCLPQRLREMVDDKLNFNCVCGRKPEGQAL